MGQTVLAKLPKSRRGSLAHGRISSPGIGIKQDSIIGQNPRAKGTDHAAPKGPASLQDDAGPSWHRGSHGSFGPHAADELGNAANPNDAHFLPSGANAPDPAYATAGNTLASSTSWWSRTASEESSVELCCWTELHDACDAKAPCHASAHGRARGLRSHGPAQTRCRGTTSTSSRKRSKRRH